ncbi:hypothetical protein [Streptomyces sp. NRRL F-5630]|uniref:hypothetical protein n=1 Tax=Streptomyces sp. NRRL F-5630 TaxID=1463864 RepID=UPI003D73596B
MKVILRAVSSLAVLVAVFAATAAPASAATTYHATDVTHGPAAGSACDENAYFAMCYEQNGDEIYIKDKKADGHAIVVNFFWAGDIYVCRDSLGKKKGWTWCNNLHNLIPENKLITLWGWVDNNGGALSGTGIRFDSHT